jgi:hypothetical protein
MAGIFDDGNEYKGSITEHLIAAEKLLISEGCLVPGTVRHSDRKISSI